MIKPFITVLLLSSLVVLGGCASNNAKTPCPNFGRFCAKAPINSWNYNQ